MTDPIIDSVRIERNDGSYLGAIFLHESGGFSHSILPHGSDLLYSSNLARAHFFATKAALPAQVHRVIFGD